MAFSDPQSITISGTTTSLPRVSTLDNKSVYQSSDGLLRLLASSAYGSGRTRQVLRFDHAKITADPYIPANNRKVSSSTYLVFDRPADLVGYTNTEMKAIYTGFNTLYTAGTSLLIDKLLAGES